MVRAIMWKLSIEDDLGQSTVVQLVRSEYSVGRTEENSIRLTERNISRRHAKLVKQGAAWFLDDIGSYNGCFVNGLRVVDHHPVSLGDLIQLGDYRLELLADDGVAVATPDPVRAKRPDTLSTTLNLAAQTDRLVMVVGPTPGREYMLAHAPQRVGRGEECDICVNHSSVSRWHADLHYVGSCRYEIIDHGSSNGIRINGVELRRGLLDARDLVELGDIVLKFIPTGQVYRPSPEESKQLAALLGVDLDGPEPTRVERMGLVWRSLSRTTRWGTILLGLTVVVLLVLSQFHHNKNLGLGPELFAQQAKPHQQALLDATRLLAQGQVIAAHEKVSTIPDSSNLRRDPSFRTIETRWAEELLQKAEAAATIEERRGLLDAVAQATTVDALTRRKAADALASLRVEAVDVAALPSSSALAGAEPLPDAGVATDVSSDLDAQTSAKTPPAVLAELPPQGPTTRSTKRTNTGANTTGNRTASIARTASPSTANKSSVPGSAPEPNAAELATSGNLESLKAARDALRRKVSAGTATDREIRLLRALCRQLGDTSCPR
jgi:ABC transport system ATP-binding/permease protein